MVKKGKKKRNYSKSEKDKAIGLDRSKISIDKMGNLGKSSYSKREINKRFGISKLSKI